MTQTNNSPLSGIPGLETFSYIGDKFLHICKNKSVLEVGPFFGWITEEIIKHGPSALTLIESSKYACEQLHKNETIVNNSKIIHGDVHYDLSSVGKVEVALLLGIIYHSHAPLHIFEELVNKCDPDSIIVDNPGVVFNWNEEKPNDPGMRFTTSKQKTCDIVFTIDEKILVTAFKNLGYKLVWSDTIPTLSEVKQNTPIYKFEKE